ncbi:hypothetical protein SYNTR_0301 [Candidatus Syntrophocurvum alkaliphilum]|uniref:Uncharacterized protein n=1 Tax=Candidatus Syntrophocurvum alkaliphilum TaxID=2293317 RepID=A0A6I6DBR4_9FIRM|nr:hypothetical protein SYNTR_0301 [Candidatus Syntrophocurvum alkaliphilum]
MEELAKRVRQDVIYSFVWIAISMVLGIALYYYLW